MIIIIDTNVLLHCKPLHELGLPETFSTESIKIVLCSTVLEELDERKNDSKTSERAKSAAQTISRYLSADGIVSPGVTLLFEEVASDSESNRDSRILQHAGQLKGAESEQIFVLTNDLLMMMRAKAHGVETIEPRPEWMKPSIDDAQREIRRLENENSQFRNRSPKLKVLVSGISEPYFEPSVDLVLGSLQLSRIGQLDPIEDVKKENPEIDLDFALAGRIQAQQFNYELKKFFSEMERFLSFAEIYNVVADKAIAIDLVVENINGTVPASNVRGEVFLDSEVLYVVRFRDFERWKNGAIGFEIGGLIKSFGQGVLRPDPPERPKPNIYHDPFPARASFQPNIPDVPFEPHFSLEPSERRVSFWAKTIDHHDHLRVGSVVVIYRDKLPEAPVQWTTSTISDELPNPVKGKIVLRPEVHAY